MKTGMSINKRLTVIAAAASTLLLAASTGLAQAVAQEGKQPTPAELRALPKPSSAMNEPAGPKPPDIKGKENAALVYYRAWDSIDRAVFTDVNQNYKNEPGAKLSEAHMAGVKDNQKFVQSIMHATDLEECDWGVDFEEGPNALLPHLGFLRGSCRFLGADVRRCVQENDISGAAKRVVAITKMSTQMRGDHCLISALVSVAINGYAISVTRNMMTEKSLTPEAAHLILAAFKGMPEDPFGFKTCLDMERNMLHWTKTHFTGEHAGEEFSKAFLEIGEGQMPVNGDIKKMNEAALDAEIEKATKYYDELDNLWGQPGKDKEFAALEQRLEKGEFGTVAMVIAPAVWKANQSGLKAAAAVDGIEKELEAFIRGEDTGPATVQPAKR